jgi:hypothetical protein
MIAASEVRGEREMEIRPSSCRGGALNRAEVDLPPSPA